MGGTGMGRRRVGEDLNSKSGEEGEAVESDMARQNMLVGVH